MKLSFLLIIVLLLGAVSFVAGRVWRQDAEAAKVSAVALSRLGIEETALVKSIPEPAQLKTFGYTITQIRTLVDKEGVERYHLTRQRLVKSDGSFIEKLAYNGGRITVAWSDSDGKYLEYTKGGKAIRHIGQWPGLPDPAELSRQARAKNALFVIEHGLPSAIETHNADNPSRRVDAVHAFQINLPLRIAHPNGKTTTVSLIKGEPDQAEWDRIKSLVPADLPVLTEGQ